MHNSEVVETDVYFVEGVMHLYLSLGSCKKLCLVDQDFPLNNVKTKYAHTTPVSVGAILEKEVQKDIVEQLKTIPDRPIEPPFPATEDHITALEIWLRNAFQGSCLNTTDNLLKMSGGLPQVHC